jgi:tRNA(Ile)-lysidine synthase
MMGASMTSTVRRAVDTAIQQIGQGLVGVACSGGADSMALADAAIDAAGPTNVVVIAIDHGLQAETATVTEAVARWAHSRGAAAIVERVHVEARASLEAAAREARYAALDALAERLGVVAILTGHTARDQAETVLMRIVRGTGPAGLAGIPARRDRYVRPLLEVTREDVDAYVAARGLPIWNDPMNDDAELLRTRIRSELLPVLRTENPQLDAALVRLAAATSEWLEVIDAIAAPLATLPLDVTQLQAHPAAIRKRAVSIALDRAGIDHDAVHLDAIDALVRAPTRGEVSLDLPGARIVRSYDAIALAITTEPVPLAPPDGPYELRVWQPGDRMRPARLRGRSRKLSDLFGDAKVPRSLRATARVVVRLTDREIVWAEHLGIAHEASEIVVPKPVQMGGSF